MLRSLKLLTPKELMELLKVNKRWIDRRVAEGDLHPIKVGNLRRFTEEDVFAYLANKNPDLSGLGDDELVEEL
jgi:excisionase family DNA binding protein